jgi:glycosyltransferase involved in cell wall biosynthesis
LTAACAELVKDENLRERLGKTGREFVKDKFAPEVMVDKIEQLYNKLVSGC